LELLHMARRKAPAQGDLKGVVGFRHMPLQP
jgi:hypothetical protein